MFLKEVSGFLFLVGFCCLAVGTLSLFSESRENINFISPLMVLTALCLAPYIVQSPDRRGL